MLCLVLLVGSVSDSATWGQSQTSDPAKSVDWQKMLDQCDMVWGQFPKSWDQGPFLGNGEQGTLLYRLGRRELRCTRCER